jgi:hypothetical protein
VGVFCVELGTCGIDGFTWPSGQHFPAENVRVYQVGTRMRLGAVPPYVDYWFVFDEEKEAISKNGLRIQRASEVLDLIDRDAVQWWECRGQPEG